MQTQAPISKSLVGKAHSRLTAKLTFLNEATALVPQSRSAQSRGGLYGTNASIAIMQAFTQAGIAGYTASMDGFQPSDLAVLPGLYPHAVTVIGNWQTAKQEIGELDVFDIAALVREICDLTESIAEALAEGQEAPSRSTITPEIARQAARQSLISTGDVIKLGMRTFKDGFNITKLPELFNLFPAATSLATNAPLAVQAWSVLNFAQKCELVKIATDVVASIYAELNTAV
jgi:hypothetical protein